MRKFCASLFLLAGCGLWVKADTFVVTTSNDNGPGSLRQAITDANAHPNIPGAPRDVIAFSIPAAGVQTIAPFTPLPTITDPVIIDGYTQPGSTPNTNGVSQGLNTNLNIELDGINIPLVPYSVGLAISSGQTTIRGLIINRFHTGILFKGGSGNVVAGNYIGTDPLGTFAPKVDYPEDQQTFGVILEDCGTTRIGGRDPASRNLLSGNWGGDVLMTGFGTTANVVEGNIMGLKASGTFALVGNNYYGSSTNVFLENGASANLIGGTVPEARNVMGGFALYGNHAGISFSGAGGAPVSGNLVKGNFLGLDVTGTARTDSDSIPGGFGIVLRGTHNVIGGPEPGARNVISGNRAGGILIDYDGNTNNVAAHNLIQGNFIGTDVSGLRAVANGHFGIQIRGNSSNNIIGGVEPNAGNRIAYHPLHGIEFEQDVPVNGTGNAILGNSIYANDQLGIDLNNDGVTPNDVGDADLGTNNLQNYPVLESADFVLDKVRIRGSLNTAPSNSYRIEFFGDTAADSSGFGEARTFLGTITLRTGPDGLATFDATLGYPAGTRVVTATATDPDGNTSEFSRTIAVTGSPAAQLFNISSRARVAEGDKVLIAGVIVGGPEEKKVIFRAIGPSLVGSGLVGALSNPTLVLYDQSGAVVASNDNWKDQHESEIQATGLAPENDLESAIIATLNPGQPYTAVVQSNGNSTGIALVEAYALDPSSYSQLLNISTRALVGQNDDVLIGGLIAGGGNGGTRMLVRAGGPSLKNSDIVEALADPVLELHDENGDLVALNDDWKQTQMAEIITTGLAPTDDAESAILTVLPPGKATAIVRGKNGSVGVGLVELYDVP